MQFALSYTCKHFKLHQGVNYRAGTKLEHKSYTTLSNRIESAELTDRRIHVMNEVISGIRVIKMYAWEEALKKVVAKIRK